MIKKLLLILMVFSGSLSAATYQRIVTFNDFTEVEGLKVKPQYDLGAQQGITLFDPDFKVMVHWTMIHPEKKMHFRLAADIQHIRERRMDALISEAYLCPWGGGECAPADPAKLLSILKSEDDATTD